MAIKATDREGKRHPLSLRVTAEVRKGLEAVASASGRSLTQEAELRLERSFRDQDALGGPKTERLVTILANAATLVEQRHGGASWDDRPEVAAEVRAAWSTLLDIFMGKASRVAGESVDPESDGRKVAFQALVEETAPRLADLAKRTAAYVKKYPPGPNVSLLLPGNMPPSVIRPGETFEHMDEEKLYAPDLLDDPAPAKAKRTRKPKV